MVELSQLLDVLQRVEHELLLFAAFWFVIGAVDELAVDCGWLWLRMTGRATEGRLPRGYELRPLDGRVAVLVPAWHEADVIGELVAHTLKVWPHDGLALYVGCYCNDPKTLASAMAGAGGDPRVRLVVHDRAGPTTKADCLNRLYRALIADEVRRGISYTSVVLHDAEDMVHPAALPVIDRVLEEVDFVQLPVRPEPQTASQWIAGHYSDEFTEAHAKSLVVRDVLGAAIPAAGVGCGFARAALDKLAQERRANGEDGPFSSECLTEDYELGLLVSREGARGRFVRVRDSLGELVATRAFFPATLDEAVRQKARWIHGISLQGWDRLGWGGRPVDVWMALRDRRGPLTAVVLAAAYSLLVVEAVLATARLAGWQETVSVSPALKAMLAITLASFVWRAAWRFGFTAYEYGIVEGLRSLLRIPVANIIAIMAGRRALFAYVRTLRGADVSWDKTTHRSHPASFATKAIAR
ncbi:MAG: glycosyl transferase family protein [Novosphingobium sp.]|nr:glycosyl transferase family protein [Novosphingobium sp.]MCP5404586.1 glycosyl transferase family protein [Novosphingobium sp.]